MSPARAIRFDTPPRLDRVTLAVVPIDGFSGALVPRGVSASVKGLANRPVVNASGMLVFLNLPPQSGYEVDVALDGYGAAFFPPPSALFTPPDPDDEEAERKRRLEVLLVPRPQYPFPTGTTLIRGVVVRGSTPVAGAAISVKPDQSDGIFKTLSDEKGAFALALRLSPLSVGPPAIDVHISEGGDARGLLGKPIEIGRSHSFMEPIDLAGNNDPDFSTF